MGKKIDIHVHIGQDHERTYSPEEAIRLMDKNGIDYAVISPVPSYPLPYGVKSSREQNDNIASALKKYPERFIRGLGVVDPRHGEAALPEVPTAKCIISSSLMPLLPVAIMICLLLLITGYHNFMKGAGLLI